MQTRNIKVALRDGEMGAYLALPDRAPAGAIIAIMEIWGVNDTMRHHAHEFAQAGFLCLVPDLFWRQEPGVELSDANPAHVRKAFDLYYDFDYDLAVRDMEGTLAFLRQHAACNGKVGAVGYCLGGKLCYLMCCRTDIDCAVAYYGTYIEHHIREAPNLHRPFVLHMAMRDRWVQAEVGRLPAAIIWGKLLQPLFRGRTIHPLQSRPRPQAALMWERSDEFVGQPNRGGDLP